MQGPGDGHRRHVRGSLAPGRLLLSGTSDWDFTGFAIDHVMDREDSTFWDARKKQLVLMVALSELAYVVGRRYPIRDKFILKPKLAPEEIVR